MRAALAAVIACALLALTRVHDLERQPFGASLSEVRAPPRLGTGDMVVTASGEPMAFVATVMPDDVPIVGLFNNFMQPGRCTHLRQHAEAAIAGHRGRLWLLSSRRDPVGELVAGQGLNVVDGPCQELASRYGVLYLCPLDASSMTRRCPGP